MLQIKLVIHIRRSPASTKENLLELVELSGYFRKWVEPAESSETTLSDDEDKLSLKSGYSVQSSQVLSIDFIYQQEVFYTQYQK